jgi:hypothetical protein
MCNDGARHGGSREHRAAQTRALATFQHVRIIVDDDDAIDAEAAVTPVSRRARLTASKFNKRASSSERAAHNPTFEMALELSEYVRGLRENDSRGAD